MVVDDHAVLRGGLKLLIDSQPDMHVVGEAGTLAQAIEVIRKVDPRVVTLDLSMPGPSGVAGVERLRAAAPMARILVLTMHDDPAFVRAAVAMGASGYVVKSSADTELITAIRAVASGKLFIDVGDRMSAQNLLSPRPTGDGTSPLETLSDREREVLTDVARGFTNQHVADRLGLSVKTVESYRARLMKKLGLKERADLVRLAMEMGLLTEGQTPKT
jgi:DNA-binding NarL/FixJ family response regulator